MFGEDPSQIKNVDEAVPSSTLRMHDATRSHVPLMIADHDHTPTLFARLPAAVLSAKLPEILLSFDLEFPSEYGACHAIEGTGYIVVCVESAACK